MPFDETVISLEAKDFKERVIALSGTGKVPVLIDGETRVWELLAILEYLAEKFPAGRLWPNNLAARAHARTVATEMHAGFVPLRNQLPMNTWRPVKHRPLDDAATANVVRIDALWSDCRTRFGAGGPFLFGVVRRCRCDVCACGVASSIPTLLKSAQPPAPTCRR